MRLSHARGKPGESGMQQLAMKRLVASISGFAKPPEWDCPLRPEWPRRSADRRTDRRREKPVVSDRVTGHAGRASAWPRCARSPASCVFSSCHNRDHREAGSAARPRDALGKPNLFSNQFAAEHGPDRCLSQPEQLPGVTSPNKQERESQSWHNQSGLA